MSNIRTVMARTAGLAVLTALACAPASGQVPLDSLRQFDPDNDVHVLLLETRAFFGAPVSQMQEAAAAAQRAEEVAVVLWIAREANVEPARVAARRAEGLGWSAILSEMGVSRDRLYVDLPEAVGPPYRKAQTASGEHGRYVARARMSDDDVVELVLVQVTAEHFHQPAMSVVQQRRSGTSFAAIQGDLRRMRQAGDREEALLPDKELQVPEPGDGRKGGKRGRHRG